MFKYLRTELPDRQKKAGQCNHGHWMQTTDIITNKKVLSMDKGETGMLLLSKEDIKSVITMKDVIRSG